MQAFRPVTGGTVSLAVTATSASAALPSTGGGGTKSVRVHNAGTATAFVRFSDDSVAVAVLTDMPIPSGATEMFTVIDRDGAVNHIAAIAAGAGTATVYATVGEGI